MAIAVYAEVPRLGAGVPNTDQWRPDLAGCVHAGCSCQTKKNDNGITCYIFMDCPTCTSLDSATWQTPDWATARARWGL